MSAKCRDEKNRWRSKTVAFRVSPEEWSEIENLVRLSGLTKQDYIMSKLVDKEINITTNPRVEKALRDEIKDLINELDTQKLTERVELISKFLD